MKKVITSIIHILLFYSLSYSQGCQSIYLSLEQRIEQSDLVVEGRVIKKESYDDKRLKSIFTRYQIEVYKVFKGNVSGVMEFNTKGGIVGDKGLIATQ